LGRLGQFVGVVLLLAGLGLVGWGAPYYMLDWGGARVMAGAVLASAGLICVLIGTVLIRLKALREDILALRAERAVDRAVIPAFEAPASGDAAPLEPAPGTAAHWERAAPVEPTRTLSATPPPAEAAPAAALPPVAVAGVAAGGLAMAAKSIFGSVNSAQETAPGLTEAKNKTDDVPEPALSGVGGAVAWTAAVEAVRSVGVPADPVSTPAISDQDRASLDDLLREIERGPDLARETPASLHPVSIPVEEDQAADSPALPALRADDLLAKVDDAVRILKAEIPPTVSRFQPAEPYPFEVEPEQPTPLDAIFDDLRADLRSAPLVLNHAAKAAPPEVLEDKSNDVPASTAPDEPVLASVAASEATPEPVSSDEGIIAAYNVGDSSYAMLADGRIRVSTPDKQHLFMSMDELKLFMAERRSQGLSVGA